MLRQKTLVSPPASPIPADALVTWTGGAPADEEARAVWQALHDDHASRYAELVERVGDRLFRLDLESFGVAADVGFFRPFYFAYARQIVAALAGTLLRIGPSA